VHRRERSSNARPLPVSRRSTSQSFSEHCETTDTGWCITRYACLLSQLSPGTHSSRPQTAGSGWVCLGAWFSNTLVKIKCNLRQKTNTSNKYFRVTQKIWLLLITYCMEWNKHCRLRVCGKQQIGPDSVFKNPSHEKIWHPFR